MDYLCVSLHEKLCAEFLELFDNDDIIMNNDRPPACKLRKWLMRNDESILQSV